MVGLTRKKWFWPVVLLPGVVMMILTMAVRVHSELQYDEAECRFSEVTRRGVGRWTVTEEMRQCEEGVEERRWLVHRDGEAIELGRRRLSRERFGDGYQWTPEISDAGVSIRVQNPGLEPQRFGERTP